MNAEQKQQAKQLIADWTNVSRTSTPSVWFLNGDCMAGFLQELVDAPEPDPVGYVTTSLQGSFGIGKIDGCKYVKPGTILYARPPTPAEAPASALSPADKRIKVKLGSQYGSDLNGHWFYLRPADEYAEAALAKHTGKGAPEAPAVQETWPAEQCAQVLRALRYIQGIAERGEGRPMRDNESLEEFLLGYVQRIERKAPAVQADLRDAERYRWLRNDGAGFDISVAEIDDDGHESWVHGYPPEELDAGIDAAIAAKKGGAA